MVIGAPDQVAEKVEHLEAIGVDTLLLVCSFGNLSHDPGVPLARAVREGGDPPATGGSHSRPQDERDDLPGGFVLSWDDAGEQVRPSP